MSAPVLPVGAGLSREAIVTAARGWLGTPYVHQASAKGQGTDCLGLLRGLFRELLGAEPELPPPYTPDWNERRPTEEPLLSAARRHLAAVETPLCLANAVLRPGQVAVFRVVATGPAKHCGVVADPSHFIHAYAGRAVIESALTRFWRERLAGVFEFPGVEG
jgi:NlpC/P60 family putative phage cell wall peptidase